MCLQREVEKCEPQAADRKCLLGRIEEGPVPAEKLLPEPHLPGLRCGFHTQKQGQGSEQRKKPPEVSMSPLGT